MFQILFTKDIQMNTQKYFREGLFHEDFEDLVSVG